MAENQTLPNYLFSRDWWQFKPDEIDLILNAMRQTQTLTHEEYYRLNSKVGPPAAVDRTLLLAVAADVIVHLWQQVDRLNDRIELLTQAVARLQQGPPVDDDDTPGDYAGDDGDDQPSGLPI